MSGTYRRSPRNYEGGYDCTPRKLAQDQDLSYETVGLIVYLLSKPDDWEGSVGDIEKRGDIGYEKRRRMTLEAEEAGYMAYRRERCENGKLRHWYEVFDIPLPADQRTNSKQGLTRPPLSPPPEKPGTVKPSTVKPSTVKPGDNIIENSNKKELQNKDIQKAVSSELKSEEELQALTGEQPTDEDKTVAQQLLFLRTGKTWDVHKGPELLAWVQNTRRVHKQAGVDKLLAAHVKPEEHGISREWPKWKIDTALFETNFKPKPNPAITENSTSHRIAACAKYQPLREKGTSDDELVRLMTDEFGIDIAYTALTFMKLGDKK